MNQYERIVAYVKRFGSISPMEAFNDLGITKLSTRIGEMEQSGQYEFNRKYETVNNRFGEPVRYMRYTLKGERKNGRTENVYAKDHRQ